MEPQPGTHGWSSNQTNQTAHDPSDHSTGNGELTKTPDSLNSPLVSLVLDYPTESTHMDLDGVSAPWKGPILSLHVSTDK